MESLGIVNEINSYNYSSIEKIMYAYDLVRNMDGEINSLFNEVLKELGLDSTLIEDEHKRVKAHIIDDKYNIDGIYYFDPSMDTITVDSYKYFAKTLEELIMVDQHNKVGFTQEIDESCLGNKELHATELLKILYKIRTNEYYKDPNKYNYEPATLYKTMVKSYWSFEDDLCEPLMSKYRVSKRWCKHSVIIFKHFCEYHELFDKMKKVISSRKAGIALDSSVEIKETKK